MKADPRPILRLHIDLSCWCLDLAQNPRVNSLSFVVSEALGLAHVEESQGNGDVPILLSSKNCWCRGRLRCRRVGEFGIDSVCRRGGRVNRRAKKK